VTGADEQLAIDVAIADRASVVRTEIVDDDHAAALQPGDRHRPPSFARRDHRTDRHESDLSYVRAPVVRVVPQLVE
jgi:hypothetical protein